MQLVDTHCHIHEADHSLGGDQAYAEALTAGVTQMVCVGTDVASSEQAVAFAATHPQAWASIGLHPHDAARVGPVDLDTLEHLVAQPKVVAVGECGLDYFYNNSPKDQQVKILHAQIQLALRHDKPIIFHVRDAFDDFWPILDQYTGVRGVLHSFTDNMQNMQKAIGKGLFIGVNGISTFTKVDAQKTMFAAIPLDKIVLETDAPFLTPVPLRGKVNQPAYVMHVAQHIAKLQNISLKELADATTANANKLLFT